MKRITVSFDDDAYRRLRIKADRLNTSVSAVVRGVLADVTADERDRQRLQQQEREMRALITNFRAGDRLTRDWIHDRRT